MSAVPALAGAIRLIHLRWRESSANWLVSLVNKFVPMLILISLVLFLLRAGSLPPQVPLWYAKPWGETQLAHPLWLLILPATSFVVYLVNVVVAAYITSEHLVFTQLLYATSLLVSFLSFVTLAKILFLIT